MGLQLLEYGDFPHGGGGNSFILILKFDLFEGDDAILDGVSGLEDHSIGALS